MPMFPYSAPLAPRFRRNQYPASRNRRHVGYWAMGVEKGENERDQTSQTRKTGGIQEKMTPCWCPAGFRQVPWGSASFSGGPLRPMAFLLAPIFQPPSNTRRFETAETWGIGAGGRRGQSDRIENAKTALKRCISGRNSPLLVFRGEPPGSAVVHCANWHFSSLLYSTRHPIPGVSKPPTRWVFGNGRGGGRGDRKRQKNEKSWI